MPAEYYSKIIYPLQDRVITSFRHSPFYLTGGTALSRGYYNHRYSDDLDYFVNDHPDFSRIADREVEKLRKLFDEINIAIKGENFFRFFIGSERLKIEMINDVPAHTGGIIEHPVLGLIDSKENILANKLTALVDRCMPKDIVDIYYLLKDGLSLKKALSDAESKAAGISPLLIAKIIAEFNYGILDYEIKWINSVSGEAIKHYMNTVSLSIIKGTI